MSTTNSFLTIINKLQTPLDEVSETRLVQLYFSAAFDHVNRDDSWLNSRSTEVGGHVLSVMNQVLSGSAQYCLSNATLLSIMAIVCHLLPLFDI